MKKEKEQKLQKIADSISKKFGCYSCEPDVCGICYDVWEMIKKHKKAILKYN